MQVNELRSEINLIDQSYRNENFIEAAEKAGASKVKSSKWWYICQL